jgi:hypothetical protein
MVKSRFLLSLLVFGLALSGTFAQEDESSGTGGVEDDEYADIERAHLVVLKSITGSIPAFVNDPSPGAISGLVVQGRNVTIVVDIYNSGVR